MPRPRLHPLRNWSPCRTVNGTQKLNSRRKMLNRRTNPAPAEVDGWLTMSRTVGATCPGNAPNPPAFKKTCPLSGLSTRYGKGVNKDRPAAQYKSPPKESMPSLGPSPWCRNPRTVNGPPRKNRSFTSELPENDFNNPARTLVERLKPCPSEAAQFASPSVFRKRTRDSRTPASSVLSL